MAALAALPCVDVPQWGRPWQPKWDGGLSAGTEKHGGAKRTAIILCNEQAIFFIQLNKFSSIFFFLHQWKIILQSMNLTHFVRILSLCKMPCKYSAWQGSVKYKGKIKPHVLYAIDTTQWLLKGETVIQLRGIHIYGLQQWLCSH
jgi:hypothetical protein